MIQLHDISKWFGDFLLYENLSLFINEGSRIGLIAKNGTGKSTLLNMIAGKESCDSGQITFRKDISVGYLSQEADFDNSLTLLQTIYRSNKQLLEVTDGYHKAIEQNSSDKIAHYSSEMERLGGWEIEHRAKSILSKLNIDMPNRTVATLSGGEKRRLALASVLIDNNDVLILDEPTNHLDLEMSLWLEEYLIKCGKTIFMVTHDRYFLDRVCSDIYEIDQKELFCYKGGYSDYVAKRAERIENQASERERAQNLYRKELEWMRRMPQARGTKAKYRKDAFYQTKEKAFATRNDSIVQINSSHSRLGTKIFEVENLSKRFGDKVLLENFSYNFTRGEKLGVIGKNGAGKSTFLKMLTGTEQVDGGKIDIGSTVQFGYYRQEGIAFDSNQKVIDAVRDVAEAITLSDGRTLTASALLTQFLFEPAVQHSYIAKLSGGERRRLYLLTILMQSPNFLILDEPTNDLDIMTLNVLEAYLESYSGCVIVVSHDRYFMDKVTDHLLIFEGEGKTSLFEGNYTQYRNQQEIEQEQQNSVEQPKAAKEPKREKPAAQKRLSYKEQKELEQLEIDIESLEAEKISIEQTMSQSDCSLEKITELSLRHGEVTALLDEKSFRWLELEELKS